MTATETTTPASQQAPAICAQDLQFAFGDRRVLHDVSFDIAPGSIHGFLGPNGAGKSTLFKLLATILPMQGGEVSIIGLDLRTQIADIRRRIGIVFQSPALDQKLTVRENLRYGGHLYGLRGRELDARMDEMLERTGLDERKRDKVGELSGGLKRRVELCKGLLPKPDILLLDEPTTGLDPGARKDLWRFLREQQELTVLVTTHLIDEAELLDHITILDQGSVVAEGKPGDLRQSIGGEVLQVDCAEPAALAERIKERFQIEPVVLEGGGLRLKAADAHHLVGDLVDAFGPHIDRVSLSHPSLEDVYILKTGHRFWIDTDTADDKAGKKSRRRKGGKR